MPSVPLIVTDAGIAEVINAEASGTALVKLTEVGLGSGQYTAATGQTALVNEVKRLDTISGGGIGDNIIHVSVTDESSDTYEVHEIGVFTESGTLFAVYAQSQPIIQKASASWMMLSLDIALVGIPEASVTFGDTNFVLPSATTETQGIVELATDAEVQTGTDTSRAVTPKGLASRTATESRSGIAEISTQTEVEAGTDDSRIVSPKKLKALLDGRTATEDKTGLVELATNEEVQTGTDTDKAVTPAGLASRTATETRTGLVELATTAEVQAGTDTSRAVTPKGLASRTATESRSGIAEIATQTEVDAGTDDSRIVSPKKLKEALDGRSATTTPKVAGTGAVGSSTKYAREDHVHPAQTSVTGSSGSCTGNAATAAKLQSARTIDGVSFNGSAAITHYGTCSTAASTAAKVVALSGFALVTGSRITVRFTVTNTAASPTLNVNSTGAKAIRYRNSAISAGYLAANRTYEFVYDGSYWQLVGDIDTDSKLSIATQAEAEAGTNNTKAMSALRVKQSIDTFAMPVGSVYVQFSGQSAPADLFGGTWSNISSTYAGRFFRAEGESAASFGGKQSGGLPGIYGRSSALRYSGQDNLHDVITDGCVQISIDYKNKVIAEGSDSGTCFYTIDASMSSAIYGAASEVRPINSTIRIWKRTA